MTDKQLKIQEAIMIAIHGDLEKAREKEFLLEGCLVDYYRDSYRGEEVSTYSVINNKSGYTLFKNIEQSKSDDNVNYRTSFHDAEVNGSESYDIIGLPLTLSRVVTSLGFEYGVFGNSFCELKHNWFVTICDWKLLNEDGSDATLFDQSEETQDAIYNLLIS